MNAKIKNQLEEKNYTVDYIDRDDEKKYYLVYNDNCEIMASCDFNDDENSVVIKPSFSECGTAKCSDNSEDILLKNELDEYVVEQIISAIE